MKNILKPRNSNLSKSYFLIGIVSIISLLVFTGTIFADAETANATANVIKQHSIGAGLGYIAAAISIAVGSIGSGVAVAASAPAALGAFSENPSTFGKTIVFVALGEGVSILSFIVSMMILRSI